MQRRAWPENLAELFAIFASLAVTGLVKVKSFHGKVREGNSAKYAKKSLAVTRSRGEGEPKYRIGVALMAHAK